MKKKINIMGVVYDVVYLDKVADVDADKRDIIYGQIDYWNRTIRIYKGDRQEVEVIQNLLHEIIHGVCESLSLPFNDEKYHDDLDRLAVCLVDTLLRNKMLII